MAVQRQAEVQQHRLSTPRFAVEQGQAHDVARVQVPMGHARPVQVSESHQDVPQELQQPQAVFGSAIPERVAR
jgi:hypothetical protein